MLEDIGHIKYKPLDTSVGLSKMLPAMGLLMYDMRMSTYRWGSFAAIPVYIWQYTWMCVRLEEMFNLLNSLMIWASLLFFPIACNPTPDAHHAPETETLWPGLTPSTLFFERRKTCAQSLLMIGNFHLNTRERTPQQLLVTYCCFNRRRRNIEYSFFDWVVRILTVKHLVSGKSSFSHKEGT